MRLVGKAAEKDIMPKMDAYPIHLMRTALYHFAHTLVWTAMLLYQIQCVGLTPLQLVLVGTTLEATVFLCEIPTGIGSRPLLVTSGEAWYRPYFYTKETRTARP